MGSEQANKQGFLEFIVGNALGIIALTTLIITNLGVIMRYIFAVSMPWNEEIVKFLFIWMVFVGFALSYRNGGLAGIMFLEEAFLKRRMTGAYRGIKLLQHLVNLGFGLFCTYWGWDIMLFQQETEEATVVLKLPLYLTTAGFTVGFALFSMYVIRNIIRDIRG